MQTTTIEVNTTAAIIVKGTAAGQTAPADLVLIKDGAVTTTTPMTWTDMASNFLYQVSFTPLSTGIYTLHAYGIVQARIEVVVKSLYNSMRDVTDEALGSWSWDRVAGILTMLRSDGTTLATYAVVDNLTTASRQRTS